MTLPKNPFQGTLTTSTGEKKVYKIHPDCLICKAENKNGVNIRLQVDERWMTKGHTATSRWLLDEHGINASVGKIATHMRNHSSAFLELKETAQKAVESSTIKTIAQVAEEYIDAEEVIQEVITLGGNKIRTGEIEVDGKLLVAMVKEQGSRKKTGTLQDMLRELDRDRFKKPEEGVLLDE